MNISNSRIQEFEEPQYFELCSNIRTIEPKKYNKRSIDYLSIDAIKILLRQPNSSNKNELRDLALLSLLYDSGARVQELIDLQVCSLFLNTENKVCVTGKGNKTRYIPLNKEVTKILKKYISIFRLDNTDLLFTNKYGQKLTRQGVKYIINKYIQRAQKENYKLYSNIRISPHCLRHSKAMHLLEGNINLIYIRDFLGHTSVITTEIYAKANPEIRRKQIEKCSKNIVKNSKFSKDERSKLLKFLKEEL